MNARVCSVCGVKYWALEPATPPADADRLCPVCRRHRLRPGQAWGLVVWFQPRKGYGFVRLASGARVYCHGSRLRNAKRLHKGDLVRLRVRSSPRGAEGDDIWRLATRRQLERVERSLPVPP